MTDSLKTDAEIENEQILAKQTQKTLDVIRAYKTVFNSSEGKIVLYDMMKVCGFRKSILHPEPVIMGHNEGKRSVIIDIIEVLEKDEKTILDFFRDAATREEEYEI